VRQDIVDGLVLIALIALILVTLIGLLVVRRYLLARAVGSFDCALRMTTPGANGHAVWAPGVARYESDRLDWYPFLGVGAKPGHVMKRQGLEIVGRREARALEATTIQSGWVVVVCDLDAAILELAMEPAAYDALAMWLESAPPGQHSVFS